MSKRAAEQDHVIALLKSYGAKVSRKPRTDGKEVVHDYEIDGNRFSYSHGTVRGGNPKAEFERDLKRAHRRNCAARRLKPSF